MNASCKYRQYTNKIRWTSKILFLSSERAQRRRVNVLEYHICCIMHACLRLNVQCYIRSAYTFLTRAYVLLCDVWCSIMSACQSIFTSYNFFFHFFFSCTLRNSLTLRLVDNWLCSSIFYCSVDFFLFLISFFVSHFLRKFFSSFLLAESKEFFYMKFVDGARCIWPHSFMILFIVWTKTDWKWFALIFRLW